MKFGSPIGSSVAIINSPAVTVSGAVTVTSGSIAISNSPTVSVASGSINIANTPAVTVNSGTIAIGNTPTVKIASGTVTASLAAGSKIQITGPVSLSAGTVVGVSSISNNVSIVPASGSQFNVQGISGGTAIGIAGTVTISSGSVNIGTISGAVSVINQTNTLLQVSDALTLLQHGTFTVATRVAALFSVSLPQVSGAIFVRLTSPTPFYPHAVQIFNGTIAPYNGFVTTAQFGPQTSTRKNWQAIIPVATVKTGKITLEFYFTATTGPTITYSIFASTENPGVILRPDGRTGPLGVNCTRGVSSSGNATIVPNKASRRIFLKSLLYAAVSAGNPTVRCTVNGAFTYLYTSPGSGRDEYFMEWEQGLLLDVGTALSLQTWGSGTLAIATAVYDWTF